MFVACTGLASGASADDENTERLDTVKVARSGDKVGGARATKVAQDGSLSAKISLPMLNPNPTMPKVVLSEGHKKTCLKRIGDKVEVTVIKDVEGRDVKLKDELSEQLTVVVFWSEQSVSGYEQFRRIPVDVLARFAPYRVKVVAVNVGGTVAETKRLTGSAKNKILSLADTESEMFKEFANGARSTDLHSRPRRTNRLVRYRIFGGDAAISRQRFDLLPQASSQLTRSSLGCS